MDPFGFTRLTKFYSQDLLAVAMAGCYPDAEGGPCVKEGRADTAVVLLRDPDLAAFDEPWPPRYGFHARVLKAIRANKPKAVVIDIVFEDKRDDPTIAALAAELDRYRAEGIPVYAATFGIDRPLRPEVGERVVPVQVPKKIDPLDRVTRFYDLTTGPPQSQLTAAPMVFRDVCGGCQGDGDCGTNPIRVFWSNLPEKSWNDPLARLPPAAAVPVVDRAGPRQRLPRELPVHAGHTGANSARADGGRRRGDRGDPRRQRRVLRRLLPRRRRRDEHAAAQRPAGRVPALHRARQPDHPRPRRR